MLEGIFQRLIVEFSFNPKGFPWTHVHFSSRMFLAHSEAQSVRRTCGKMGEDRGGHISLINLLY